MIIKSITLKNFRQYRDETTIHFSTDKDKDVTVFIGDNNRGKSTLIQAFLWTIYNKEKLDLKCPTDILNKATLSELQLRDTAEVFVEIILVHGNIEYTFLRRQTYSCIDLKKVKLTNNEYSVWYTENGQKIHSTQPITTREKILPEDLAEYFFFDGEHIKKLNEKKNLRQSIAKLLGLLPLQNAVKDLDKVSSAIDSTIPKTGNSELISITKKLNEAQTGIERFETEKKFIQPAYEAAKSDYEDAQQRLSDIKLTCKLISDRKSQINTLNKEMERSEDRIINCSEKFNNVFFNVFSASLIEDCEQLMKQIEEENLASEAIPYMHADSIKYILEKGKCICGANLKEHPELVEHIKQLSNLLPPHSIGTEVATFTNELELRLATVESDIELFTTAYAQYLSALNGVDEAQKNIKELDSQLRDVDNVAIEDIRKKFQESEKKKNEYQKQLNNIDSKILFYTGERQKAQKEKERLLNLDDKYKKPRIYSKYANQLADDIDYTMHKKESSMLEDFRTVLDSVFSEMYHGEREVYVDDNYAVHLYVPGVGETATSEGTDSVLGFAYVCSLLKLALDQMDDPELASEPHTFVMDAPTSDQDEKHIANVFKYTITVADQIILFINNKDWQYVKPVLESKIDKTYELRRVSEIHTTIRGIQ